MDGESGAAVGRRAADRARGPALLHCRGGGTLADSRNDLAGHQSGRASCTSACASFLGNSARQFWRGTGACSAFKSRPANLTLNKGIDGPSVRASCGAHRTRGSAEGAKARKFHLEARPPAPRRVGGGRSVDSTRTPPGLPGREPPCPLARALSTMPRTVCKFILHQARGPGRPPPREDPPPRATATACGTAGACHILLLPTYTRREPPSPTTQTCVCKYFWTCRRTPAAGHNLLVGNDSSQGWGTLRVVHYSFGYTHRPATRRRTRICQDFDANVARSTPAFGPDRAPLINPALVGDPCRRCNATHQPCSLTRLHDAKDLRKVHSSQSNAVRLFLHQCPAS
jgi:hypothetical protein